ncbi:hypothetical protein BDV95DRAFT_614913 [Massariosphaeria phaeospora]|uniref:Uncharacterized protein n=1 Tax=Massariosphaeria phaeospora TaxID=100035 RepID=A0A7C8IF07_9PLEO|nr:hypothetical protein BDV95DRAFT_614913 [Massariosphaeria phaeospora]
MGQHMAQQEDFLRLYRYQMPPPDYGTGQHMAQQEDFRQQGMYAEPVQGDPNAYGQPEIFDPAAIKRAAEVFVSYKDFAVENFFDELEEKSFNELRKITDLQARFTKLELNELYEDCKGGIKLDVFRFPAALDSPPPNDAGPQYEISEMAMDQKAPGPSATTAAIPESAASSPSVEDVDVGERLADHVDVDMQLADHVDVDMQSEIEDEENEHDDDQTHHIFARGIWSLAQVVL